MRVFFYGTLMDPDVRRLVLGPRAKALRVEPAVLPGYRRVGMRRRSYPVVVPDPRRSVEGCLAHGVDREQFARLTDFESDEYVARRRPVVAGGREYSAWVYVASALAAPTLAEWRFETWRERHKRAFLRRHRDARR